MSGSTSEFWRWPRNLGHHFKDISQNKLQDKEKKGTLNAAIDSSANANQAWVTEPGREV